MILFPRRRAIVFSLMTVLLSTFFILLFWSGNTPRLDTTSSAVETRVMVADQYLSSWDAYTQDAAIISTRGALLGMTQWISNHPLAPVGTVTGMEGNISSCLVTGNMTLGGSPNFCFSNVNNSLTAKLNAYASLAQQELNINTTYQLDPNITVTDWAPFELRVSFGINYTVQDASSSAFARWNRSQRYDVIVSVEGLPDPLFARYGATYMKNVPGANYTQRNITQYPVPRDQFLTLTNTSNLLANISDLIAQRMYVEDRGMAPTYLERLAENLTLTNGSFDSGNSAGIETLINPSETKLSGSGFEKNTSFTDYQVFNGSTYTCGVITFGITNLSVPKFSLDTQHLARYINLSLNNIINGSSCS